MRFSKLLVLSALWLGMASAAKAVVPQSQWTIPEPQGLQFTTFTDDGERYYLYNPGAKMFFASGNSWNTQASVRAFGYPFWVEPTGELDAPDGSYELWDDFSNPDRTDVTGAHNLFTDDGGSTWVDHASQGNYSWSFTLVGDFVRFQNVAFVADFPEYEGKYIGWTGAYEGAGYSSVLRMVAPDDPGVCVDWRAVTTDSYEAFAASDAYQTYTDGVACYFLAQELRPLLVEAEEIGADVAAQLAVFTNLNSTPDELKAAIAAAREAIDKRRQELIDNDYENATVAKPVDVTAKFLKNFDFKGNDLATGWSGTAFGSAGPKENAEHYNKTYDTYQDVNGGMKPGIYALGVKAFYRAGNAQPAWDNYKAGNAQSKYAKVYGQTGKLVAKDIVDREASITSPCVAMIADGTEGLAGNWSPISDTDEYGDVVGNYLIPNNMEAAEYAMHTLGLYDNKVIVAVMAETDSLRIGVRKSSSVDGDWSIFDDFSLTYYGKGADACSLYLEEALKNFSDYTPEEGVLYTEAYLTAYREALGVDKTAGSLEEVSAILNAIDKTYADLMKNIELWKEYQEVIRKGTTMATDPDYEGIDEMYDLMDYIDMEAGDNLDDLELTNEELEAAIKQVNDWMNTIDEISKKSVWEGKNMTKFIKNPGFDEDKDINSNAAEGWTIDRISGGNVVRGPLGQGNQDIMVSALGEQNFCFESWHCHKWDVWQEITGLPTGMYELQVQGYVRCEVGGYTQGDPIEPDFPSPVYLYMNSAQTSFPSVYDEAIDPSHYLADGTLPVVESHSWTGAVPDYPNSMGAASLCFKWGMYKKQAYGLIAKDGDTFRIGVKMDADQDWWCIWDNFKLIYHEPTADLVLPVLQEELAKLDLAKPMGKDVYERATAVKAAAEEAIASADGVKMFAALSDLYDLGDAINTSVALFARLSAAAADMWDDINASDNEAAKTEAQTLYYQIVDGIDAHSITDAEAEEYLEKIAAMKTALALPGDIAKASDDYPVEVTGVIVNPDFETGDASGWTYAFAAVSNIGFQNNSDYSNDEEGIYIANFIEGWRSGNAPLGDGTIEQTIQALPEGTYSLQADVIANLQTRGEGVIAEDGEGLHLFAAEENGTKSAVSIATANGLPRHFAVVFHKAAPATKLTIGLEAKNATANWLAADNFQLFYYGKSSAKQPDADPTGIEETAAPQRVYVEFFTLDGRKATSLEKGIMIQKVTTADGNVIVKKVRK